MNSPKELNAVRDTYKKHLQMQTSIIDQLNKKSDLVALARLVVFMVGTLAVIASLWKQLFLPIFLLIPLFTFIALVIAHDRVIAAINRARCRRDYWAKGLDRVNEQWFGKGNQQTPLNIDDHLFARDLDLFGPGSLFELIDTTATRSGSLQLARWLTDAPASLPVIKARQQAVAELEDQLALREELHFRASQTDGVISTSRLSEFADSPPLFTESEIRKWRVVFLIIGIMAIMATVSIGFTDFGLLYLFIAALAAWITGRLVKVRIEPILDGVEGPKRQLQVLSTVLETLEQHPVKSELLITLQMQLGQGPEAASVKIGRLSKLVNLLDGARNQVLAPFAFVLMWRQHMALQIETWRINHGPSIASWLAASGQMEALCALSTAAYERPDDIFPDVTDSGPLIEARDVGHPLLKRDECIRNDISLGPKQSLWLVSGSNMSGKSTFLRAIGINSVLAMAGAKVCARQMRISPMNIGSTIRVMDSLQQGKSRFYAEVSTLGKIVKTAGGKTPLLFLLDEIFHGTNSHDRQIGAHAIIVALLEKGAIGLVTTHDLAITKSVEELGERARNVHFEDQIKDGRILFDYRLKQGPITRSNALALMRSVGLDV